MVSCVDYFEKKKGSTKAKTFHKRSGEKVLFVSGAGTVAGMTVSSHSLTSPWLFSVILSSVNGGC